MRRDGIYIRNGAYWISWTDAQGKRRRRKTDSQTIKQARLARSSEQLKAEKAKTLGFTPPSKDSFDVVADRYLQHQKARLTPHAYERERGIVEDHLKNAFTGQLASIRRVDIERYITKRSADVSGETIRKELNCIKHLLKLATQWELIAVSPAVGIKGPKAAPGRVRYLQPTELRALMKASPAWLRPIIALAVNTGMRRGEILKLRWLDIDLDGRRILLPQTKNGEGRIVYLNDSALAVLQGQGAKLFAGPKPEWVSVAFKRVCASIGIQDFHFHDLRHTAASWLRMSGADIHTVAQILGHKDLRMAARYQHLSPDFLMGAVTRLDVALQLPLLEATTKVNSQSRQHHS